MEPFECLFDGMFWTDTLKGFKGYRFSVLSRDILQCRTVLWNGSQVCLIFILLLPWKRSPVISIFQKWIDNLLSINSWPCEENSLSIFSLPLGCLFADKIFQCRQLKRTILCSSMIVAGRLYITKKKKSLWEHILEIVKSNSC